MAVVTWGPSAHPVAEPVEGRMYKSGRAARSGRGAEVAAVLHGHLCSGTAGALIAECTRAGVFLHVRAWVPVACEESQSCVNK